MKGFIIEINDEKTYVGTHTGVALITTYISDNNVYLTIGGVERSIGVSLNWIRKKLCVGDKVKITAANIKTNSPSIKVGFIDRQELLSEYYKLKEILTENNMLK